MKFFTSPGMAPVPYFVTGKQIGSPTRRGFRRKLRHLGIHQ